MKIYKVTIPFKSGPLATYFVMANTPLKAEITALDTARSEGLSGAHKKIKLEEL